VILLRHNQYCKDPQHPTVRKTEVPVTLEYVEGFWQTRIIPKVQEMMRFKAKAERWFDLPEPSSPSVCNDYGGCPFQQICNGSEDEAGYELRYENQAKMRESLTKLIPTVNSTSKPLLSLPVRKDTPEMAQPTFQELMAARLAQSQALRAPVAEAVTPVPAEATPPVVPVEENVVHPAPPPIVSLGAADPETEAAVVEAVTKTAGAAFSEEYDSQEVPVNTQDAAEGTVLPPWVDPMDKATVNGGCGFNIKGQPDAMSKLKAKEKGLPSPEFFDIEILPGCIASWQGKTGTVFDHLRGRTRFRPAVAVKAQEVVKDEPQQREQPPVRQAAGNEAPTPAPEAPAPQAAAGTLESVSDVAHGDVEAIDYADTQINGVLLLNCIPMHVSRKQVVDLNRWVEAAKAQLAAQNGVPDFYLLDAWRRRDALGVMAQAFLRKTVAEHPDETLMFTLFGASPATGELNAVANALRPVLRYTIVPEGRF
jgi:hypothetical protein